MLKNETLFIFSFQNHQKKSIISKHDAATTMCHYVVCSCENLQCCFNVETVEIGVESFELGLIRPCHLFPQHFQIFYVFSGKFDFCLSTLLYKFINLWGIGL